MMPKRRCEYEGQASRWRCMAPATYLQSYLRPQATTNAGVFDAEAYCTQHLRVVESEIKRIRKDGFEHLLGSEITVTAL